MLFPTFVLLQILSWTLLFPLHIWLQLLCAFRIFLFHNLFYLRRNKRRREPIVRCPPEISNYDLMLEIKFAKRNRQNGIKMLWLYLFLLFVPRLPLHAVLSLKWDSSPHGKCLDIFQFYLPIYRTERSKLLILAGKRIKLRTLIFGKECWEKSQRGEGIQFECGNK